MLTVNCSFSVLDALQWPWQELRPVVLNNYLYFYENIENTVQSELHSIKKILTGNKK